ncbi:tudor domain-containing protein 7A isoform X2 [Solea solea]|uniref:tudor domain-containing protein 7A isoform X2 n=1 Tax=Solea solea TaxID=90069 RepID=UPI00272BFDEB|nr:tudor domain-containing protein 7A isoform X2 [Solea solea]
MSDSESVKKMLRSVLLSSKGGVSLNSLHSEYRSLCGESIPLNKLGYSNLENFLKSIPSVVRMEYRMGEMICFAGVSEETASIAELVARQKSSKKSGHSQVVNCRMRFKPSNPYMLNMRPRSSLRQPSAAGASNRPANHSWSYGGFSASGDYRQLDQRLGAITPVEHRQPAPQPAVKPCVLPKRANSSENGQKPQDNSLQRASSQSGLYDKNLVQSRITQLLGKFCCGVWLSKIPEVYSAMFNQKLHPQVIVDLEKWTHICMVEQSSCNNRAEQLLFPPLPQKPPIVPRTNISNSCPTSPTNSCASTTRSSTAPSTPEEAFPPLFPVPKPRVSPKYPLAKPTFVFPPQPVSASPVRQFSSVTLRSPVRNLALSPQLPSPLTPPVRGCKDNPNLTSTTPKVSQPVAQPQSSPSTANASVLVSSHRQPDLDILPLLKVTFSPSSGSSPVSKSSADTLSAEVRQRIKELLSKYSQGLWAHALPKLFMETYKVPFPEYILENLSLLLDMCSVEYSVTHGKKKAILYNRTDMEATDSQESKLCRSHPLPSGLEVLSPTIPPRLVSPSEQYPSVLVTDAKSSNSVTIRYVGENYSNAQEAMEDVMRLFYSQGSTNHPVSNPVIGQLVAVRGEDGDELARAQVMELMALNKVKVYHVDYGFSVETSWTNLMELHQDFLSLPFQATNVRLAGLETFSSHPMILSYLDKLAVGKILLIETLEPCQQMEMPVVVLYDTSQDDDININSACLKSLQDKTMDNPLTVNVTYQDVCVTNVCADGSICCQLPCRGTARLSKLLKETEAFFISQMTSESLVSRPFSGKFCLARYKEKWSRAEITNMYNNRILEILFIDLGILATVEVTDLREIPPPLLKDFAIIPPQAIKCRLADLKAPEGDWSPEALLWLKEAVLGSEDCRMKILKLEDRKGDKLVYMYLFVGADGQDLDHSINHQLAHSELWLKVKAQNTTTVNNSNGNMDTGLSSLVEKLTLCSSVPDRGVKASMQPCHKVRETSLTDTTAKNGKQPLPLPPLLELPQPGQNMDVFVPVACHPSHFVLQPWQDLHRLTVLLGEMILYYNQMSRTDATMNVQRGDICAAKIDKNWQRAQVKGILANGFVSVYDLDHGKHDLVRSNLLKPLIEEFRQLPFQAIPAKLAGVSQNQWSEEASMLFRNHVERRPLVAQMESVQEVSEVKGEPWERRLTVYLVDTTLEDKDLWIHTIMADIDSKLYSAA